MCTAKERTLGTINVGEYVEPGYSGQSIERRPFFQDLLKRIVEQGDVDYVVIDLGAGTAPATLDLYLASDLGITVTTPEIGLRLGNSITARELMPSWSMIG